MERYFFSGIGGSGMSALAAILRRRGADVSGSDRSRDKGENAAKFAALESLGICLYPQDGSGVAPSLTALVVSSAIEPDVPDIQAALRLNIPVRKRAEILAGIFNTMDGIGIGGTSGKTTVTGMAGVILTRCGLDPTIVNGGIMADFRDEGLGNVRTGLGPHCVAELDESDGSIALFDPSIAVLNNITLDHRPIPELLPLFGDFLARAKKGCVVNMDDAQAAVLPFKGLYKIGFGIDHPQADLAVSDLRETPDGIAFNVQFRPYGETANCALKVPGRHNVSNALAAIGAALLAGVSLGDAAAALEHFHGIGRRLEKIGTARGVTVIDDFAHNPDKIAASLRTLAGMGQRTLVMFQPHGFGPMKLMRRELVESFIEGLRPDDRLYMPEIFYAGGTTERGISSLDITEDIKAGGRRAAFFENRDQVGEAILKEAQPGDVIAVMGARDDTFERFRTGNFQSTPTVILSEAKDLPRNKLALNDNGKVPLRTGRILRFAQDDNR